jgi:hypothetical protein
MFHISFHLPEKHNIHSSTAAASGPKSGGNKVSGIWYIQRWTQFPYVLLNLILFSLLKRENIGPDAPAYFSAEFDTTPENVKLFSGEYTDPYWPNSTLPSFKPPVFTNASSISGG